MDPVLLFLDIDGTLLPFGGGPYPTYEPAVPLPEAVAGHPLLNRVDPALGTRLLSLGCAPVWATTWMDDANTCLSPWLGLPRLPFVDWPDPDPDDDGGPAGPHWKTRPLVSWAAGRPFVWVDDEITEADRVWVAAHHPARALLHRVDHQAGLTERDFEVLEEWLGEWRGDIRSAGPARSPYRRPHG
ncbi:HAD domain-containing protein [Streptomyces pseudovenezuelae]|uniref:HAD domain-containing protein n=1 Tax=Streptomyces pseudovenezuelae TaxID=67350 RepID=UPI002E33157F|nr:HAD domain-containing protein [Streptomyces pseudovenezuelae]